VELYSNGKDFNENMNCEDTSKEASFLYETVLNHRQVTSGSRGVPRSTKGT